MAETATAQLISENLANFCPATNHYACSDGRYLLVTVTALGFSARDMVRTITGLDIPVKHEHAPTGAEVFLADENAVVIDADGDPANGMTALASYPDATTHAEVLERLGYTEEK